SILCYSHFFYFYSLFLPLSFSLAFFLSKSAFFLLPFFLSLSVPGGLSFTHSLTPHHTTPHHTTPHHTTPHTLCLSLSLSLSLSVSLTHTHTHTHSLYNSVRAVSRDR